MKLKRRKRRTRLRGSRTAWRGFRKKGKKKGHKGGVGMSGTGKRAGQKLTYLWRYLPDYFGKRGFHSKRKKFESINIEDIEKNLDSYIKNGIAKKTSRGLELDFSGKKVIGKVEREKFIITASAASKSAIESVKKNGGEVIIK